MKTYIIISLWFFAGVTGLFVFWLLIRNQELSLPSNEEMNQLEVFIQAHIGIVAIDKYPSEDTFNMTYSNPGMDNEIEDVFLNGLFNDYEFLSLKIDNSIAGKNIYFRSRRDMNQVLGYNKDPWQQLKIGDRSKGGVFVYQVNKNWILLKGYNRQSNPDPGKYEF